MNYLGIDWGEKHIGVALATGPLAEPLTTLTTKNALQKIKQLIYKHKVDEIVVGVSNASMHNTVEFVRQLGIPVHLVDETLSSHDARQALMHTTQKKRRLTEHSVSAAIILQSWLDNPVGVRSNETDGQKQR